MTAAAATENLITCIVPFRFGRRVGDRWTCTDCGRKWFVASNMFDSLLPYGDYTWWTDIDRPGRWGSVFGPKTTRARQFLPEPPAGEREVIGKVQHALDALGLPHTLALTPYDLNPSAGLPYHGAPHLLSTALRAWELAKTEGLSPEESRPLIAAALFHDADYVPGRPETENIGRAITFMSAHVEEALATAAARLIDATSYPHRHTADEGLAAHIIQDADLLQTVGSGGAAWRAALEKETGRPANPAFPSDEQLSTAAGRDFRARAL